MATFVWKASDRPSSRLSVDKLEATAFRRWCIHFYVHPDFQGQGVGKALLKHIESVASRVLVDRLFCDVSLTARAFFESQNFVVTEARQNVILGHSAPNFAMEKHLSELQK